jgi:hypothetical protein
MSKTKNILGQILIKERYIRGRELLDVMLKPLLDLFNNLLSQVKNLLNKCSWLGLAWLGYIVIKSRGS